MKRLLSYFAMALALAFFVTGCANKATTIKALKPAKVGEMADMKKLAVVSFKNDNVGLSSKTEAKLAGYKLDKKRYFTVVNRNSLNKIIAEQKLQNSELLDSSSATQIGKLAGAEVLITGEVTSGSKSGQYKEDREKCLQYYKGGGCAKFRYYKVTCHTTNADVSGTFNVVDVTKGTSIYAETISKNYTADSCKDSRSSYGLVSFQGSSKKILSETQAKTALSNQIANEFAMKLVPQYVFFKVEFIEDFDYKKKNKVQDAAFEAALKFASSGRLDKAKNIFAKLHKDLKGKSFEVAYNLGVCVEGLGDLNRALRLYQTADELLLEPNKNVNLALARVEKNIQDQKEAEAQIKK